MERGGEVGGGGGGELLVNREWWMGKLNSRGIIEQWEQSIRRLPKSLLIPGEELNKNHMGNIPENHHCN
jgi:hypothetical protein